MSSPSSQPDKLGDTEVVTPLPEPPPKCSFSSLRFCLSVDMGAVPGCGVLEPAPPKLLTGGEKDEPSLKGTITFYQLVFSPSPIPAQMSLD